MFGLSAFNRLIRARQKQQETQVLRAGDALSTKQIHAGLKALRLLKLHKSLESLSKDDMMDFLYAVGMNPTPDVLDGKLRLLRVHKKEMFTWGELAHVWSMLLRDAANEDQILERAFAFFDKDGNGEISVQELRTTMSELGNLLTEEEICAFISIMDVDNDGVIGYQEFLQTLRSEVPQFARMRRTVEEHEHIQTVLTSGSGDCPRGIYSPRKGYQQWDCVESKAGGRSAAALEEDPTPAQETPAPAAAVAASRSPQRSSKVGWSTADPEVVPRAHFFSPCVSGDGVKDGGEQVVMQQPAEEQVEQSPRCSSSRQPQVGFSPVAAIADVRESACEAGQQATLPGQIPRDKS